MKHGHPRHNGGYKCGILKQESFLKGETTGIMGVMEQGVHLICDVDIRESMISLLVAHQIPLNEESHFAFVERGQSVPEGKTAVVFDWRRVDRLFDLMATDSTQESSSDPLQRSVIGKAADDTLDIIAHTRVCYFEARNNTVYCVTADGEYRVKEKLYELETTLPFDRFIRISKSYIVNIENVSRIIPWFGRRLVLRFNNTKKEVEVSKNYVTAFKSFLNI